MTVWYATGLPSDIGTTLKISEGIGDYGAGRRFVEVWRSNAVVVLELELQGRALADAHPELLAKAAAWQDNRTYERAQYTEAQENCAARQGRPALICENSVRGRVAELDEDGCFHSVAGRNEDGSVRLVTHGGGSRALVNIPDELLEMTGVAEYDVPLWGVPITVVANKSKALGYAMMKRLAADPDLLTRVEEHGRIRADMDAKNKRPPATWFRRNNELFGLEARNR